MTTVAVWLLVLAVVAIAAILPCVAETWRRGRERHERRISHNTYYPR